MDVNSKDGKLDEDNKVILIGHKNKDLGNTEKQDTRTTDDKRSAYMENLFKNDPSRYWYIEAKKAEIALEYLDAANKYLAAYSYARKNRLSSAVRFKWESMRCIEFHEIYQGLLKEFNDAGRKGRFIAPGVQVFHWYDEKEVLPSDVLMSYKKCIPLGFAYNVLIWDENKKLLRFIHCPDFYTESEPVMQREYIVGPDGWKEARLFNKDPELLFDKWMLVDGRTTFDKKVAIRRSIKIRYLKIPECIRARMGVKSVWDEYVVPAIGNRSIGKLYEKFISLHV